MTYRYSVKKNTKDFLFENGEIFYVFSCAKFEFIHKNYLSYQIQINRFKKILIFGTFIKKESNFFQYFNYVI